MRTVPNNGDLAGALASIFPSLVVVVERAADILLIRRKNVVFEDASLETGHDRAVIVVVLVVMDKTFLVQGIVIGVKPHFQTVLDVLQDNDVDTIGIEGRVEVAGNAGDVSETVPSVSLNNAPLGHGPFGDMLAVPEPDFKEGPEGIGLHILWRI